MARIAGVDLPADKRVVVALTYIFGIGPASARKILACIRTPPCQLVPALPARSSRVAHPAVRPFLFAFYFRHPSSKTPP